MTEYFFCRKTARYVFVSNHTGQFLCGFVARNFILFKFLQHKKAIRSKRADGLFLCLWVEAFYKISRSCSICLRCSSPLERV